MTSYATEDIRRAFEGKGRLSEPELIWRLATLENDPVELADSDTVTVKEVWQAQARLAGDYPLSSSGARQYLGNLLEDILQHREPEYPPGTTWMDSGNPPVPWYRTGNGTWLRFGEEGTFSHNSPKRPLKRMDVL